MILRATLAAACLAIPVAAGAQTGGQTAPVRLNYVASVGSIDLMVVQTTLAVAPQTYRVQASFHLIGMVGAMFHAESTATVDGRFQGASAVPRQLFSTGSFRGQPRTTQIDWQDGKPVVTQMAPPVEPEREPVSAADQAHAVDALSAMALVLHQIATTGRCEGAATIYDGRRLSGFVARTAGREVLEATNGSSFHGPALRCEFEGHQVAGFWRDTDMATLRKAQRGTAWFARLAPGQPPVPVRISVDLRSFGTATMYLVDGS